MGAGKIRVASGSLVCSLSAYGPGAVVSLPSVIAFSEEDARKLEAMLNEALAALPLELVDEKEEWQWRSGLIPEMK